MMIKNTNPDYLNEQYFEDWGADELSDNAHRAEDDDPKAALRDLVNRADGYEGVRADGSNIDTIRAHAALGDFSDENCSCDGSHY
jgi:hypothetical protein